MASKLPRAGKEGEQERSSPDNRGKRGLIVTVGAQAEQIKFSIAQLKPTHVVFIATASENCRKSLDDIQAAANLRLSSCKTLETEDDSAEIGRVVSHCLDAYDWLTNTCGVPPEEVLLDCTGGRKWMSAGAIAAATHLGISMCYVHVRYDERGEPDPSTMRVVKLGGLYENICLPELQAGVEQFNRGNFTAARELFSRARASDLVIHVLGQALQKTADLADKLDRFLHFKKDLSAEFDKAAEDLERVARGKPYLAGLTQVAGKLRELKQRASRANTQKPSYEHAPWVVAAAGTRLRRGQYDGAILLYYRTLELAAQVWLWEWNDLQFDTSDPDWSKIPQDVQDRFRGQYPHVGKLGLVEAYVLLALLGHPQATELVRFDEKRGRWAPIFESALIIRNQMAGVHGFQPVSEKQAQGLKHYALQAAEKLTGMTEQEIDEQYTVPKLPQLVG